MDDRTLAWSLQRIARQDDEDWSRVEAELARTAGCPPLTRHRAATLRHDWSEEEWSHVKHCASCQRTCEAVRRAVWHPPPQALFGYVTERLGEEDFTEVRYHLEDDACLRCQRLIRSRWLDLVAAALREGRRSAQSIGEMLEHSLSSFTPLPLEARFAAVEEERLFRVREELPGGLAVTLRRTDRGKLVVEVQTSGLTEAGRTVHVEIMGERESLTATVILAARGERCTGRHVFGVFADLLPTLGRNCLLFAVLTDDRLTNGT